MDPIEDLSELRRSIKQEFSDVIVCSPPFIQLYDEQNQLIDDLDVIPPNYYQKKGPSLLIRIASFSNLDLINSCLVAVDINRPLNVLIPSEKWLDLKLEAFGITTRINTAEMSDLSHCH
jgi:hypothetical protein